MTLYFKQGGFDLTIIIRATNSSEYRIYVDDNISVDYFTVIINKAQLDKLIAAIESKDADKVKLLLQFSGIQVNSRGLIN